MKNNYPIRYAVMPIYEFSGYQHGLNELEPTYDVSLYIVSKCYLIEESIEYKENGEKKNIYKVVYPYEEGRNSNSGSLVRCEPQFNLYNQSINSVIVDKIFDSFDSCLAETERLNEQLLIDMICNLPYNEDFSTNVNLLRGQFNEKLKEYRKLEEKIENGTSDLIVNDSYKYQNIIISFGDKDVLSSMSLYWFIKKYYRNNYCVYNVSNDEFEKLSKMIDEDKDIDFLTSRVLLLNDKEKEITRITDCDNDKTNGSYYLKNNHMFYDKDMIPFHLDDSFDKDRECIKVYTLENYEDIIKSYLIKYVDYDNHEIEIDNKTLSKVLVK